jgi:uncharacterized phosphosugar-binding protein
MNMGNLILALILALGLTATGSVAETVTTRNGTDLLLMGDTVLSELNSQGDAIVAAETVKVTGGPDIDTPQALILRLEPKANVERYDDLRAQIAGGRHAS